VLKVYKSRVKPAAGSAAPGTVSVDEQGLSVKTADQSLLLLELQQEGRRRMTAEEFLRGYPIRTGDTLA
jgi:methionyl-tRNA formyltransferase